MIASGLRVALFVALAVLVPAVGLDRAAGEERRAAELSAAPFAWRSVLIAHLAAAVPLGLAAASWLRSRPMLAKTARLQWALLGIAMTGIIALVVSPALKGMLAESDFGAVPLLFLRAFFAFALVLPWCVAAVDAPPGGKLVTHPAILFAVTLGLSLIPCALYFEAMSAARADEAAALLTQQRLARAESVVSGLCELGSHRPVGKMTTFEARQWLSAQLPPLRRIADQRLPASPDDSARLERAVVLVRVERLDDAAKLLRPLVPKDDAATAMLAAIYRNQERRAESDELYQGLLTKLLPQAAANAGARSMCESAFEGLAENARADRRPADAEAALTRALRELPGDSAQFHFLLGRQYREAGKFEQAMQELETAARLDPTNFAKPVDDMIQQMRTSSLGCFTQPHRSSAVR